MLPGSNLSVADDEDKSKGQRSNSADQVYAHHMVRTDSKDQKLDAFLQVTPSGTKDKSSSSSSSSRYQRDVGVAGGGGGGDGGQQPGVVEIFAPAEGMDIDDGQTLPRYLKKRKKQKIDLSD